MWVTNKEDKEFVFNDIQRFHKLLNNESIVLNFNGSFDEEYIVNFLSIIGIQIQGNKNLKEKELIL